MTDSQKHLLLVEDEAPLRQAIAEQLRDRGYLVEQADSGEAAIAKLADFAFDIIVTDLRLPGIDGSAVVEAAVERYPHIVAIVVTGYGTVKDAVEAIKRGASDFVSKPCGDAELELPLTNALRQHRLTREVAAMREQHEYAGSMLGPPASILAKRAGLVSLGSVQDLIGPYQAAGSFTQRKWAQEHRDALVNYLAAFIEAQHWLMDPSHKSEVIELLVKESHLPADVAAETYMLAITRPGGFAAEAQMDLDGLVNVLQLRAEIEGSWGGKPPLPNKYYDSSYYEDARAKAKRSE